MDNEKVPEWALERAVDLYRHDPVASSDIAVVYKHAFARYIAEHEEPPVDPVEQAMADANAILKGEGNGTYQEVCDALESLMHLLAAREEDSHAG